MAIYLTPGIYTGQVDYSSYIPPSYCSVGCETCLEETVFLKAELLQELNKMEAEQWFSQPNPAQPNI